MMSFGVVQYQTSGFGAGSTYTPSPPQTSMPCVDPLGTNTDPLSCKAAMISPSGFSAAWYGWVVEMSLTAVQCWLSTPTWVGSIDPVSVWLSCLKKPPSLPV